MQIKFLLTTLAALLLPLRAFSQLPTDDLAALGAWQDPKTGLVWARCAVGQTFANGQCSGTASQPKYHSKRNPERPSEPMDDTERNAAEMVRALADFRLAGFSDWRLPTISELQALLPCQDGQVVPEAAGETVYFTCPRGQVPKLDFKVFPDARATTYPNAYQPVSGTASASMKCGRMCAGSLAWMTGHIGSDGQVKWRGTKIVPVRSASPLDLWMSIAQAAQAVISKEDQDRRAEADRQAARKRFLEEEEAARKSKADAEARELARQQEEQATQMARKKEAEERAFTALLSKNASPQALYLRAGRYEREGEASKARRIYEFLTESFSQTDWAVKANDRLLQLAGAEANSARQSANRQQATASDDCSRYYTGYAGQVDYVVRGGRRTIWGERIDQYIYGKFVVLGSGNGNVSIKSTSGGSFLSGSEIQQFTCARLTELENLREVPR